MAERMARTEAILAQIQQHLGLPPIPLTPAAAAKGSQALPLAALMVIPAAAAAVSTAPPTAHLLAPAQSEDEDEVPPSTTT